MNNLKAERTLTAEGWVFKIGDRVEKVKGSSWRGSVVGFYSTKLTPVGYAVESENEPGSVQIYPQSALQSLSTKQPMGEVTDDLRYAFRNADNSDWEHLFAVLPDTGRGKFWKSVFKSAREALHPNQESGE